MPGDIGEPAAQTLATAASAPGLSSASRTLQTDAPAELWRSLRGIAPDDALVLWLRPQELAALPQDPVRASTICPLMSQIFEEFQTKLGAERDKVHLMSISIDPEEDTPGHLREYAQKFQAGPEWQYYTGTVEASRTAQVAFAVYRGAKMSHAPVTPLRAAPGKPWRRIDGLITPDELLVEYRKTLSSP